MEVTFFNQIQEALSEERLSPYGADRVDECTVLARYLWNIALSEALYASLHIFEVIFRNKINQTLVLYNKSKTGTDDWYNNLTFVDEGNDVLEKALNTLAKHGKKPIDGRLVAELNLGFWVSLLSRKYSKMPYQPYILKNVFCNCPAKTRTVNDLHPILGKLLLLRNRISHHERIIHWKDLPSQHDYLLKITNWINPNSYVMIEKFDRFNDVYSNGIDPWKAKIREHWPKKI